MSAKWPRVRLGEVLRRSDSTETIVPDQEYQEITVKLWGKGVVPRGRVSGSEIAGSRRFMARTGQLILSRIDARNGALGIVPASLDGGAVTNDFPLFDLDPARLDASFLGWLCRTRDFVALCQRASEGTTNRVRLQERRFLGLEIALPPLSEQRRVVGRIEELATKASEACILRRTANTEADMLRKAGVDGVLKDLCQRFENRPLGEVCISITDGDHQTPEFTSEGVRFIFVGNVSSGRLHFQNCKRVDEGYFRTLRAHRIPERGDILYSAVGATLGVPAIVDTDEPFCFQRHVAILKPDRSAARTRYIWHVLRSRSLFERAWAATTGSAQPTVPLRAIRELPLPVPPLAEQDEVVSHLDRLQSRMDAFTSLQAETAAELDALIPAILDRAFKGEL